MTTPLIHTHGERIAAAVYADMERLGLGDVLTVAYLAEHHLVRVQLVSSPTEAVDLPVGTPQMERAHQLLEGLFRGRVQRVTSAGNA
jgi:hypothetical protein